MYSAYLLKTELLIFIWFDLVIPGLEIYLGK